MRHAHQRQIVPVRDRQASIDEIVSSIEARWPEVVVSVTAPAPIVIPPLVLLSEVERLGLQGKW